MSGYDRQADSPPGEVWDDAVDHRRTVSPKPLEPWKVAVLALGATDDGHALSRKIGGRRHLEPLSIVECAKLRAALAPFVTLFEDVGVLVEDAADRMAGDLAGGDSTEPSAARPSTPPPP